MDEAVRHGARQHQVTLGDGDEDSAKPVEPEPCSGDAGVVGMIVVDTPKVFDRNQGLHRAAPLRWQVQALHTRPTRPDHGRRCRHKAARTIVRVEEGDASDRVPLRATRSAAGAAAGSGKAR